MSSFARRGFCDGAFRGVEDRAIYKSYGEKSAIVTPGAAKDKGWIGQRYDAGAGLQYLNARYYDPELGMFLQPDWFEVTMPGVGTNRFAYRLGDPVNLRDPGGNASVYSDMDADGESEYVGEVRYGKPGYDQIACGCGFSGISDTAWAQYNEANRASQRTDISISSQGKLTGTNGLGQNLRHQLGVEWAIADYIARGYQVISSGPVAVIVPYFLVSSFKCNG